MRYTRRVARMNWERANQRDRIRRQGTDPCRRPRSDAHTARHDDTIVYKQRTYRIRRGPGKVWLELA